MNKYSFKNELKRVLVILPFLILITWGTLSLVNRATYQLHKAQVRQEEFREALIHYFLSYQE